MEYDSNITQKQQSTVVIDPSKISEITSQPDSYWSMQDSQSRAEYLLVGPDGFKMIDELWVRSVDYDKRIEYLENLIKRINSGDKYIWKLFDDSHKRKESFDKLEIIKKSCTNQLNLDNDIDLIPDWYTDYNLNNYSYLDFSVDSNPNSFSHSFEEGRWSIANLYYWVL